MADPDFEKLVKRTIDMHRPALDALSAYDAGGDEAAHVVLNRGHRGTHLHRTDDGWFFRVLGWGIAYWSVVEAPRQAAIVSAPFEGFPIILQVWRWNVRLLTPRT